MMNANGELRESVLCRGNAPPERIRISGPVCLKGGTEVSREMPN
jgi:hypothetical protein